jgi:transposase
MLVHLAGLVVERIESTGDEVRLFARRQDAFGTCPTCGGSSTRVHGRYSRCVRDVAASGRPVVIELLVRRFRCMNAGCPARTFAEQVPHVTRPYGRYTSGLERTLASIGLELAGRAGVRLAAATGVTVGRDTLLRRVRSLPEAPAEPVTILGVDDFAMRRGRRYGTVMVDLATHRVVDMISGRDGEGLAGWLRERPEVTVICRDRAGGYGEGARTGAPQAIQVADRFHLWQNLGQAVEKTLTGLQAGFSTPSAAPAPPDITAPAIIKPLPEKKIVSRLRTQYAAVQELRQQGMNKTAIGRRLGLHPATVRKLADARSVDDVLAKTLQRAHLVDDYIGHLHQRWNDGERNATQLFREIAAQGYQGGELAVQRHLRQFRHGRGTAPRTGPKPPAVREVTTWIMADPVHLNETSKASLTAICRRDADIRRLASHVTAFAKMMTLLQGEHLDTWIASVEVDTLPTLAAFARNMRRDIDAIRNGLTLTYSSGPVEGSINRLKMIKRQMFGRANLDLLRKRVIHRH